MDIQFFKLMKSFSEIDTTVKRASKAMGFSWGVSEEIGKSITLLEMLGIPGVKTINSYFKIYDKHKFKNIDLISKSNSSSLPYCPVSAGVNFLNQISHMEEINNISINNVAFPIILLPFISRASYISGKKILFKIDEKDFLLNFNQSVYSNYSDRSILEKSNIINISFLDNVNLFSENEWKELYKLSENTFVDESEELKEVGAGAGLTDND
tara:strand:- start:1272 stop:1904 length:633 start_codon:yes stop_codon:yes gene_type:complete